jgi:hypothetical protein
LFDARPNTDSSASLTFVYHNHILTAVLRGIKGFDWDEGNFAKSETKHGVTDRESEEIFFNTPLIVARSRKAARRAGTLRWEGPTAVGF